VSQGLKVGRTGATSFFQTGGFLYRTVSTSEFDGFVLGDGCLCFLDFGAWWLFYNFLHALHGVLNLLIFGKTLEGLITILRIWYLQHLPEVSLH
jgi:hypothetical protein